MARRKKGSEPIGIGYTSKQMKRKKPVNSDYLVNIEPLTDNQNCYLMHMIKDNTL